VLALATELGTSKSPPRRLVVDFKAGGFFARQGDVLILPLWSEQQPVKSRSTVGNQPSEYLLVEWRFAVEGVSIHPRYSGFVADNSPEALPVALQNLVGIQYAGEHPLKEQFQALR
jgi:hypothetical protein